MATVRPTVIILGRRVRLCSLGLWLAGTCRIAWLDWPLYYELPDSDPASMAHTHADARTAGGADDHYTPLC